MQCPTCQFDNPDGMKFCGTCGAPLALRCPDCDSENPPGFKFCGSCGAGLDRTTTAPPPSDPVQKSREPARKLEGEHSEAERRQLTVMFTDLIGSTAMSEMLDPEDMREVLRDYQSICSKIINRYEGFLAKYLGDGLLVYFGYPQAHEDDAQRAVRTGLAIVEAIEHLSLHHHASKGIHLDVRVGVHTGLVVAGDMDADAGETQLEQMAIVGETPNISARLQGLAEPNTLVISNATYRLIKGYFECHTLGAQSLKGIAQPMEVYQVLHESAARTRLDVATSTGLTPFVGREAEMARLLERWEQVEEGRGQVVFLSGEAGIGKSRLVQMLKEHVARDPQGWLTECRCSPYHRNSAFHPVIELLQDVVLQFKHGDSAEDKLDRIEGFLVQYGRPLEEDVPLFASLLSIPLGDRYGPLNLTPERQKQKTMEVLSKVLLERAAEQPVLFVMEDLHWADPSSLELLKIIIDQTPASHLFALCTYRPEFVPPWGSPSYLTHISVHRFAHRYGERMVEQVTGGKKLPHEVLEQIVRKTDGVPLFVEELTKMVLESGLLRETEDRYELDGPLPPLAIPATLQDSLMARLDRLSTVKSVAQLGSVIGREFSYELLHAVSPIDEPTLQRELHQLVEAELLFQRGHPPLSSYIFKHALIQDAAYQSLLKTTRQAYHYRIASAMEEKFRSTVETQPELIARHYSEAGKSDKAIPYWQQAGARALGRSANLEAIAHFTHGLQAIDALPDTVERTVQELPMQVYRGLALMLTRGYASRDVEQAYTRARELCRLLGDTPQLYPVLHALWAFHLVRGEYDIAQEMSTQLLSIANSAGEADLLVEAYWASATSNLYMGNPLLCRDPLEKAITLYDRQHHGGHALLYGQDPGVAALSYLGWGLGVLGHFDLALQKVHSAVEFARAVNHPFSLGFALQCTSIVHHLRGEPEHIQEQTEIEIELSNEHGFPFWLSGGTIWHGWALSAQGRAEEGLAEIRRGLEGWLATGAELARPYYLYLLADALLRNAEVDEGITVVADALQIAESTGEHLCDAELYRIKGECMLIAADSELASYGTDEAELCFRQALDMARRQGARAWELRTAISLGRLLRKQNKAAEAYQLLGEALDALPEGECAPVVQEAIRLRKLVGNGIDVPSDGAAAPVIISTLQNEA